MSLVEDGSDQELLEAGAFVPGSASGASASVPAPGRLADKSAAAQSREEKETGIFAYWDSFTSPL